MILQRAIPYIFAFTLFVSATLVFSVQPMLGKMMLPHVGGAPAGWAVTMFFFQTCLLFGYGLAYIFSKLPPFLNILAILFIFVPATLFLPIAYQSGVVDSISPWAVFMQLTASTAVPFLALSTLAPGLQRIFSFSTHKTAGDPYYLYAASNAGSFVGLLAYPIILEPFIGLQTQSQFWMMAFGLLFALVVLCAISIFSGRRDLINFKFSTPSKPEDKTSPINASPITWSRRLKWLVLAAIPSSLMIGTTTEITTDIASAPLIWVIPLSLYLLTNIVAFAKRDKIDIDKLASWHVLATAFILICTLLSNYGELYSRYTIVIGLGYIVAFTVTAYLLHARLANDRPQPEKLTEFYLMMALGGAIGGSFNAFIAPYLFNDAYEFHLVFILSLLLNPTINQKLPDSVKKIGFAILVCLILSLVLFSTYQTGLAIALLVFVATFSAFHAKILFVASVIIFLFLASPFMSKNLIHIDRNFFGIVKVLDKSWDETHKAKVMNHGTTLHGFQAHDEEWALKPLAYYSEIGPVGDIINIQNPKSIAGLGLGVGQVACYTTPEREITFYEIDPHVVDTALKHFSVLKDCGYKDILVGDARLELAKDENDYDMVMVDTFSSDAIPVHLITSEAIDLYMSKLTPNGVVLINISNRHLDLTDPLTAIAEDKDYLHRSKIHRGPKDNPYVFGSQWYVITENQNIINALDDGWIKNETTIKPWTDDYSNLISTLKILKRTPNKTKNIEEEQE